MSDTDGEVEYEAPPWGYLVAENVLMTFWNWDAEDLSDDQQRDQLMDDYLQQSPVPTHYLPTLSVADGKTPVHVATDEEIRVILEPWRPPAVRRAAHEFTLGNWEAFPILRTHYAAEDAERVRALLDTFLEEEEDQDEPYWEQDGNFWRILDDARLFAPKEEDGSDWLRRALRALPELTSHGRLTSVDDPGHLERDIDDDDLEEAIETAASACDSEDENGASAMNACHWRAFHYAGAGRPLIVLDREAARTGRFLVVFLDGRGRIVRSLRLTCEEVIEVEGLFGLGWGDRTYWPDADVGEAYREGGEMYAVLRRRLQETRRLMDAMTGECHPRCRRTA